MSSMRFVGPKFRYLGQSCCESEINGGLADALKVFGMEISSKPKRVGV